MHVDAVMTICNCCKGALTLISQEWGINAEKYICCQGLVKRFLKLIVNIANWCDIPDLKTGLFLANIQAVR